MTAPNTATNPAPVSPDIAERNADSAFAQKWADADDATVTPKPAISSNAATETTREQPVKKPAEQPAKLADSDLDVDEDSDEETNPAKVTDGTSDKDSEFDEEFTKALDKQGINADLETLPADQRKIVEKKMRQLQAGFTKARQADRAEVEQHEASSVELRLINENFAAFVFSKIANDPELERQVQEMFAGDDDTVTRNAKLTARELEARKGEIKAKIATERADQEARSQKAERVESNARATATALKVPFTEGMELAIAAHIREHGDITRSETQNIVKRHAKPIMDERRKSTREESADEVKRKVAGLKERTPIKPGTGSPPAPPALPKPKSDEEFAARWAERS